MCARSDPRLVVFAQIHARVKAGDLVGVAVEHQGLVGLEEFGEAALASLAPAGMIDFGIHIGIEAVLLRGIEIPRSGRLVFDKTNFHQGLDALESIFPRQDHAHRSAILVWQRFAIHADAKKRKRVHGVVKAQAFNIRQRNSGVSSYRHLARIVIAFESDETRLRGRLDEIDQRAERKTDPGNDNRPALDAAVAVNALFERRELEDLVNGELTRFLDLAADGNGPGGSDKFLGILGGLVFVHAEFVEVVVVRHVVEGIDFFVRAEGAFDGGELRPGVDTLRWNRQIEQATAGNGSNACEAHAAQKFAAVQVDRLWRYIRIRQIRRLAKQHSSFQTGSSPCPSYYATAAPSEWMGNRRPEHLAPDWILRPLRSFSVCC